MASPPSYYSIIPRHHYSSEAHGLTSGQITRRFLTTRALLECCALILIAVSIAQNVGFLRTLADDTPLEEKARLRRAWALEKNNHHLDVVRWGKEERKREVLREAFRREREQEEKERQEARDTFNREMEAEESKRQEQREGWARERMEEERHRKDIERRRQGVHWSEPWSNPGCSAYGTKTYAARLWDIPGDLNWQDVCYDMPITINGRQVDRPAAGDCHRDGLGKVWATWSIDFHEEQCVLYWDEVRDMGCAPGESGMRRVEARLMNLHHGDDWDTMCKTTPATIYGQHFDQPTACIDENGRIGLWHLPDHACDEY